LAVVATSPAASDAVDVTSCAQRAGETARHLGDDEELSMLPAAWQVERGTRWCSVEPVRSTAKVRRRGESSRTCVYAAAVRVVER
jgi:hypothetical protein